METREDSAPPAHESPTPAPDVPEPPAAGPGTRGPGPQEPDAEAVAVALASLGREQRQVIMCTFYGHLSAEDTAARLGISVRDVKRHAFAALSEIRRMLRQRGVPIPRQPAA